MRRDNSDSNDNHRLRSIDRKQQRRQRYHHRWIEGEVNGVATSFVIPAGKYSRTRVRAIMYVKDVVVTSNAYRRAAESLAKTRVITDRVTVRYCARDPLWAAIIAGTRSTITAEYSVERPSTSVPSVRSICASCPVSRSTMSSGAI